jgi:hypothetical protein
MPSTTARRRTTKADNTTSKDAAATIIDTNTSAVAVAAATAQRHGKGRAGDHGDDGKKSTIVFFHPDLGIGGAERLVVDAAVGLQSRGYRVVIFTNHCDPGHCFDECRDGNTLSPVHCWCSAAGKMWWWK